MESIIQNLSRSLENNNDKSSFYVEGKSVSYAFLSDKVWSIAQQIEKLQLNEQSVLAVYATNRIESFASILAIWFTGNIYLPVNPKHPANRISNILKETNAQAILSATELPDSLAATSAIKTINTTLDEISSSKREIKTGKLLYILQTSGSSGTPKQVAISSQNLTAYADGYLAIHPKLQNSDCFLQTYEFTSDAFFSGFVIPLLVGASIVFLNEKLIKPIAVLKAIEENPVTWVKMTPSLLSLIIPFLGHTQYNKIRYAQFGGEQINAHLLKKWRSTVPNSIIANSYGPTETTVTSSIHSIYPEEEIPNEKPISIGKPFEYVIYKVVNQENTICAPFEPGELLIGGEQTMNGYLNRENETTFAIIKGQKYYKTGDRVWFDENGLYYFSGRIDSQIKYNGYRIEPGEIEAAITAITKCRSKILLIEQQLVAFLEAENFDTKTLKEQLKKELPLHMLPSDYRSIGPFPLNMAGKTDTDLLTNIYERNYKPRF